MLATVLQHFQAVDTATASAEAGLAVLALGALAGIVQVAIAAVKPAPVVAPPPAPPPPAA